MAPACLPKEGPAFSSAGSYKLVRFQPPPPGSARVLCHGRNAADVAVVAPQSERLYSGSWSGNFQLV
jgi:hypothetical protein